ncbi:MAG: DUF975 family protein [Clostridia bacterium]|nr:DUF975 family protein [Clostridia bacterium]
MQKRAADFRAAARNALSGNWGWAILAGLIASLLGATTVGSNAGQINLNNVNNSSNDGTSDTITGELDQEMIAFLAIFVGVFVIVFTIVLVWSLVWTFFSSIIRTGYACFNLDLIDGKTPDLVTLFKYFPSWKNIGLSALLETLYVFLWSLLFIIPGIIASYSYAMVPYIFADDPTIGPNEAITRSKEMMDGYRWRLFCLDFSFIGWNILSAMTCGIGDIWLIPYKSAARADFYRELSGTRHVVDLSACVFDGEKTTEETETQE